MYAVVNNKFIFGIFENFATKPYLIFVKEFEKIKLTRFYNRIAIVVKY